MIPLTRSRNITALPLLIALTLGCSAVLSAADGVCQDACLTNSNTAQGIDALISNTTGAGNTATGYWALKNNTTGGANTAIGGDTLIGNTTGADNTAIGYHVLNSNTTGLLNTAVGIYSLTNNTIGSSNTANGANALLDNTRGSNNTAGGLEALFSNTIGNNNTASGLRALYGNTSGSGNTASGDGALYNNTTGDNNTAIGHNSLLNKTRGSFNLALGAEAGGNLTTGNNNIDIANRGVPGESDTIRIGTRERHTNTFIAGIDGVTVPTGVPVMIDLNGHLGTTTSSARFKEEIEPIGRASETILALNPVSFRYKKDLDPEGIPQFGLVAEQVEKVNPDLVARDEQGKPYTVRYDAVYAMLLNEFLKEHKKVQQQEITITQLKSELQATTTRQQKQIEALTAGLQKVSAQLELSKATPQTVLNNH
jgi:Chaperone of endosialidase